jgi:hypothetical protein
MAEDELVDRESIELTQATCEKVLTKLAILGHEAFVELFNDDSQEHLGARLTDKEPPYCPTFLSASAPFPWELLYPDDIDEFGPPADPNPFWGLRYSPARVLDARDPLLHVSRQALPSDMLFCVHERLREAHEHEWPEIEQLVRGSPDARFLLLHEDGAVAVTNGPALLRYLDESSHTMVHFACHCRQGGDADDALELSLVAREPATGGTLITLETTTFRLVSKGKLKRQPLIFLNACQAAGGGDTVRQVFNLPGKFVARGAGAVVATACPVPDRFAAAFAREFYRLFLSSECMSIGEALRRTRWHFIRGPYFNPLGLAYGLYTPAHYRLAAAPTDAGDQHAFV